MRHFLTPFAALCCIGVVASYYEKKGSPFYYVRWQRADQSWADRSSGIRKDADGAMRKIEQRVAELTAAEQLNKGDGSGAMFLNWVPGWLEYHYQNPDSLKRYQNAWAWLAVYFKKVRVCHPSEVTYTMCHEYMRWRTRPEFADERERLGGRRKAAHNTALVELRTLGALLQEAVRRGWIVANPCARLGIGRKNESEKREITWDEERKIQADLDAKPIATWMGEAFLVAMRMGCRLHECRIPMTKVDEKAMTLTIRAKRNKVYTAPLHEDLLPLVKQARKEKREHLVEVPLGSNASTRFWDYFHRNGYEDLCFHCTRVTVITRLCRAGFSEQQTMAYVKHASAEVHAIYQKLKAPDVAHLGKALSRAKNGAD